MEEEVLLDDIEQEIITFPRNGNKKTPTPKRKERLTRDTLDIHVAYIRAKIVGFHTQLGCKIA